MTDAGGEPAEDEAPAHRYWFPKALARFYIPLPDPLPIRDGYIYIRTFPVWPWQLEAMEAGGAVEVGEGWLQALQERVSALLRVEQERSDSDRVEAGLGNFSGRMAEDRPHAGLHGFLYTIRHWSGKSQGIPFPDIKHIADVIRRVSAFQDGVTEIEPEQLAPHLVQDIDYSVAEVVLTFDPDIDEEEAINKSFDAAVQVVQLFQEGLYAIRRNPYREVTKELCPALVPYFVGHVDAAIVVDDYPVREWVKNAFVLRMNPWDFGRASLLSDKEYVDLDNVLWGQIRGRPFGSYMELRRESTVALQRNGDYRASVIWAAASAENVFDELLRHLMWEQGQRPEKCLAEFDMQSITQRVRLYLQPKLGGTWDFVTPGPITDWKLKVADVRNRVVHDHYRPTFGEAHDAIIAVDDLIHHLVDLLVARLKYYFRTAMQLAGDEGFQRRGVYDEFSQYAESAYPLNWHATYSRWRRAHELLLGPDRVPNLERSSLYFVYGRRNKGYWVVVDPVTELAARVQVDEDTIDPAELSAIESRLAGPQDGGPERAFSMFIRVRPTVLKVIDKWREQYHLLPLYGVRVNGGDIADRDFVWRPKQVSTAAADTET